MDFIIKILQILPEIKTSEIIQALPPELTAGFGILIKILQALGIIFIIYLVFLIANVIINIRKSRRIKEIHKKVYEIDDKLEKIINKKYTGKEKTESKEEAGKKHFKEKKKE